jgi:hypothetical protein
MDGRYGADATIPVRERASELRQRRGADGRPAGFDTRGNVRLTFGGVLAGRGRGWLKIWSRRL